MPAINKAYMFALKKQNSEPFVKVPRNIKESLNIDKVHENGIFKIEPGDGSVIYDACYIFEDVCYKNQDMDKKVTTLEIVMQLFKSIKNQIKYTIANEQTDISEFVKEIYKPVYGDDYPVIKRGIGRWINQKISEGKRNIKRVMYLTVTVRARSFEEAKQYMETLDTTLQSIFGNLQSKLYRMSGEERLAVLQRMLRFGALGIVPKNLSPEYDGWKNQILPVYTKSEGDYLNINNNRFVSVLFAADYASKLDEEKVIHSLTDAAFPVYITVDIEPVGSGIVKDKIHSNYMNNDRMMDAENEVNINRKQFTKGPSTKLKKDREQLEKIEEDVDNDDAGLYLGLLVVVYADSEDELIQNVETIQALAYTNGGYTLEPYMRMQRKALMTALPIGGRQVNNMRFLLSSSAVAWQPFYSRDLQDPDGVVLGLNEITKRLLIGNRKLLPNPHSIIIGYTGYGKSFYIKYADIAQPLLYTRDDIMVIDPNNEQQKFVTSVGGQFFDLTPQSEHYYNPFEVPDYVIHGDLFVRNRFIARKSEYAGRFALATMEGIQTTRIHSSYVEAAVNEMYEEYFKVGKFKNHPTWRTVWDKLKKQMELVTLDKEKDMLFDIVKCLEIYVIGQYDMFAHPTNINISNRLTAFGLKNIQSEDAKKPIMLTLMHFVSTRIDENQGTLTASRLIVDETQYLTKDEFTIKELLSAVEVYRKIGGIVTLAMQNVTHALQNEDLSKMFSNCGHKVLFDQGGVGANELAKIIDLSKAEHRKLGSGKKGCGVLVWNKDVYLMDGLMSKENELYELFNTDFHEKAEVMKQMIEESEEYVVRKKIMDLLSVTPLGEELLMDMCTDEHGETIVSDIVEQLLKEQLIELANNIYFIKEKQHEDTY